MSLKIKQILSLKFVTLLSISILMSGNIALGSTFKKANSFLWYASENYETRVLCVNYDEEEMIRATFVFYDEQGKSIGVSRPIREGGMLTFSTKELSSLNKLSGNKGVLQISVSGDEGEIKSKCVAYITSDVAREDSMLQTENDVKNRESYIVFNSSAMGGVASVAQLNIINVGNTETEFKVFSYNNIGKKGEVKNVKLKSKKSIVYDYGNFGEWEQLGNRTFYIEPLNKNASYIAYMKVRFMGDETVAYYKAINEFESGKLIPAKGKLLLANTYFTPSFLRYEIYSKDKLVYNGQMFIPPYFQHIIDLGKHTKGLTNPTIRIDSFAAYISTGCPEEAEVCHEKENPIYLIGEVVEGKRTYVLEDIKKNVGKEFEIPYVKGSGIPYINIYLEDDNVTSTKVTLKSRKTGKEKIFEVKNKEELKANLFTITQVNEDAIKIISESEINVSFESAKNVVGCQSISNIKEDNSEIRAQAKSNVQKETGTSTPKATETPIILPIECVGGQDSDKDGVCNNEENVSGTDKLKEDTDGDRLSDGDEIFTYGMDPKDSHTGGSEKGDMEQVEGGNFGLAKFPNTIPNGTGFYDYHECPSGQMYQEKLGSCCGIGSYVYSKNICCPSNQHASGGDCCNLSETFENGKCVKKCPNSWEYVSAGIIKPVLGIKDNCKKVECPEGKEWFKLHNNKAGGCCDPKLATTSACCENQAISHGRCCPSKFYQYFYNDCHKCPDGYFTIGRFENESRSTEKDKKDVLCAKRVGYKIICVHTRNSKSQDIAAGVIPCSVFYEDGNIKGLVGSYDQVYFDKIINNDMPFLKLGEECKNESRREDCVESKLENFSGYFNLNHGFSFDKNSVRNYLYRYNANFDYDSKYNFDGYSINNVGVRGYVHFERKSIKELRNFTKFFDMSGTLSEQESNNYIFMSDTFYIIEPHWLEEVVELPTTEIK